MIHIPGIIRKTGIVKIGLSKYLIEGFKIGIPPTETIEMKKNTTDTKIKQNPKLYISLLLKLIIILPVLLSKNLGITTEPIKKATNPIIIEINKLKLNLFKDNNKKQ